jgi:hypothetical protein
MPKLSDVMALAKGRSGVGLYAVILEEQRWVGGGALAAESIILFWT